MSNYNCLTMMILRKCRANYEELTSLINTEVIRVSYPGIPPFEAEPVKIGEFCSKTPALPVSMQEQETEASRFLSALEKKHEQSRRQVADAISFGQYRKDGGSDV